VFERYQRSEKALVSTLAEMYIQGVSTRKADDDCLTELRWLYDRLRLEEARADLAAWLAKWQQRYPRLCNGVEEGIEETFTFYR